MQAKIYIDAMCSSSGSVDPHSIAFALAQARLLQLQLQLRLHLQLVSQNVHRTLAPRRDPKPAAVARRKEMLPKDEYRGVYSVACFSYDWHRFWFICLAQKKKQQKKKTGKQLLLQAETLPPAPACQFTLRLPLVLLSTSTSSPSADHVLCV